MLNGKNLSSQNKKQVRCEEKDRKTDRYLEESTNSNKKYFFLFVFGVLLHQMYIYCCSNPVRANFYLIPMGEPLASIQ